jgi:hypothetical protein
MEQMLQKMRMDFEQQEKQFLDEMDVLNAFDVHLPGHRTRSAGLL